MTPHSEAGLFEFTAAQALFELPDHLPLEGALSRAPLLTLLVALGRPRTFVQLGLDRAAGFVAACSAARRRHTETACYGLWTGGEAPPLLEHLEGVVVPSHPASKIMRGEPGALAAAFPDGAVDLIHLQQSCSRSDWAPWSPKLSSQGVVALAHINGEPGGSAELWAELKDGREHLEVGGFGLVLAGSDPPALLSRLVRECASDPAFGGRLRERYEEAERSLSERVQARWAAQAQEAAAR